MARLAAGLTLTAPVVVLSQSGAGAGTGGGGDGSSRIGDVIAFGAKGNRRDEDDEAFAKAIAVALTNDQYPSIVHIPAGHFRRAHPIDLPNHIALHGDGFSSVLNSQNDSAFDAPILVNQSPSSAVGWRLSDLSLFGGSHGLKLDVSGEIANLRFDDVAMLMQSVANIEANKFFQTSKFFGGVLGSAPYGLKVTGRTTNAFNSFGLEWTDHSKCSMYLRGAEVVLVVGGRFEGGGQAGNATIDIEDGGSITFIGVYFENVQEYLARLRRVKVVSFVSCHFTGTHANSPTSLAPFKWDVDANLLIFRDCHASVPMPVPGNVILDGLNFNIFASHAVHELHGVYGRIDAAPRPVGSAGAIDLLAAIASGTPGGDGLYQCTLSLTIAEIGTPYAVVEWRGPFQIVEQGGVSRIALPPQTAIALGRTVVSLSATADGRLIAGYRTAAATGRGIPQLSWTIEWRRVAGGPISSMMLHVP